MAKSANVYVRIEPKVKEEAESILSALGIPASNAINMFYKQIILQKGLPFEVKMPTLKPLNLNSLTETQLDSELMKGLMDIKKGNVKSIEQAFSDIDKDYGL